MKYIMKWETFITIGAYENQKLFFLGVFTCFNVLHLKVNFKKMNCLFDNLVITTVVPSL